MFLYFLFLSYFQNFIYFYFYSFISIKVNHSRLLLILTFISVSYKILFYPGLTIITPNKNKLWILIFNKSIVELWNLKKNQSKKNTKNNLLKQNYEFEERKRMLFFLIFFSQDKVIGCRVISIWLVCFFFLV